MNGRFACVSEAFDWQKADGLFWRVEFIDENTGDAFHGDAFRGKSEAVFSAKRDAKIEMNWEPGTYTLEVEGD